MVEWLESSPRPADSSQFNAACGNGYPVFLRDGEGKEGEEGE